MYKLKYLLCDANDEFRNIRNNLREGAKGAIL